MTHLGPVVAATKLRSVSGLGPQLIPWLGPRDQTLVVNPDLGYHRFRPAADLVSPPQLLFQYPVSQSQPAPFYVGGHMGGIDGMAGTEPGQQPPPPAPMTPAPPPSASSCSAGPSPSSQGSETSFDCTHCGKSLRSRKNYSKHMFIHSGKTPPSLFICSVRNRFTAGGDQSWS